MNRNELDEAYRSGELTKEQYENALKEGDSIVRELGSDITATEEWCMEVLKLVEEQTKSEFIFRKGIFDYAKYSIYWVQRKI